MKALKRGDADDRSRRGGREGGAYCDHGVNQVEYREGLKTQSVRIFRLHAVLLTLHTSTT